MAGQGLESLSGIDPFQRALAFHQQNRPLQAMQVLLPSLKKNSMEGVSIRSLLMYGNACLELGLADHLLACFEKWGVAWSESSCETTGWLLYMRGLAHLFSGHYLRGWQDLEARFEAGFAVPPAWNRPRMLVADLRPEVDVLLHADLGFGDTFFSLRFVSRLRSFVRSVSIGCDFGLVDLLTASGLFDHVFAPGLVSIKPNTCWLPLNSLPLLLDVEGPSDDAVPYLQIDPRQAPAWCQGLNKKGGAAPLVALNWQGGQEKESIFSAGVRERSFSLQELERVGGLRQCRLISVQVGQGADQLHASPLASRLVPEQQMFDQEPHSFLKTASVLMEVDLLITNDTSVAHLGGALGIPTWVILKRHPYWQWGDQGETTPWYPSVHCFRQHRLFEWSGAMQDVDQMLMRFITAWHRHREIQESPCL